MPLRPDRRRQHPTPDDSHEVDPADFGITFDSPPTAEVLQADEPPADIQPIPVRLTNKVRVDQLPTELGITKSVEVSAADPEQLLPENPRRATINLWIGFGESVRVARTQAEARRDDSSIIILGNSGPYRFHWIDAVWAMKRAAGANTDRLCICTEDWAR